MPPLPLVTHTQFFLKNLSYLSYLLPSSAHLKHENKNSIGLLTKLFSHKLIYKYFIKCGIIINPQALNYLTWLKAIHAPEGIIYQPELIIGLLNSFISHCSESYLQV